jgi:Na+-transporting methylmalonyl-CoA/oxaloacetate decarboxylase gamma subunit
VSTKQLVIIYIAALSVTWCVGNMLGLYASINPMIVFLMVSLLLALVWLVTKLISEKEKPITQKAPAQPVTSQRRSALRASCYAARSSSASTSSSVDLTTLAALAMLSDTDTKSVCTETAVYSSSSCGNSGDGGSD